MSQGPRSKPLVPLCKGSLDDWRDRPKSVRHTSFAGILGRVVYFGLIGGAAFISAFFYLRLRAYQRLHEGSAAPASEPASSQTGTLTAGEAARAPADWRCGTLPVTPTRSTSRAAALSGLKPLGSASLPVPPGTGSAAERGVSPGSSTFVAAGVGSRARPGHTPAPLAGPAPADPARAPPPAPASDEGRHAPGPFREEAETAGEASEDPILHTQTQGRDGSEVGPEEQPAVRSASPEGIGAEWDPSMPAPRAKPAAASQAASALAAGRLAALPSPELRARAAAAARAAGGAGAAARRAERAHRLAGEAAALAAGAAREAREAAAVCAAAADLATSDDAGARALAAAGAAQDGAVRGALDAARAQMHARDAGGAAAAATRASDAGRPFFLQDRLAAAVGWVGRTPSALLNGVHALSSMLAVLAHRLWIRLLSAPAAVWRGCADAVHALKDSLGSLARSPSAGQPPPAP
ncbi:hypothetical protein ACKKBG_A15800 [Auxenochlorella protothecoides x Auxenochlorella symbiontica]